MANRIKSFLLVITLVLLGYYHGGCIQSKTYKVELSEKDKAEIVEAVAEKMAADREAQQAEQK